MTNNTNERTTAPGINAKPSEWFAHGLADWTTTRAQELTAPEGPSYAYYLDSFEDHMKALMRDHAGASAATLAELDGEDTPYSFKATKTGLTAILGGIAYQLGWRIVPAAKMAAAKNKDGELLARVEDECNQWVHMANAIRDGIRAAPSTRDELAQANFLVRGQCKTAAEIVARLRADLGKTKI
ncbi:hypothetical protein [Zoogloea sp.]|uniref:hypothetical protein n=1 Tax=Zoogloea sp. TaxID=49181 RepID=UPI0035B11A2F